MEKVDEKPTLSSVPPHRQPNFMSEMKVVLGKQAQSIGNKGREGDEGTINLFVTNCVICYTHCNVALV